MTAARHFRKNDDNNHSQSPFVYAVWRSAEAEDANLSNIELPGTDGGTPNRIRWVPKLNRVTGLTDGQTILCIKQPYIIIGIVVGDITLAEEDD